jgi:lipid-binding SYLF domain-containing protein
MRVRWKTPALLLLAALFAAAPPVPQSHAASGPEISANVNATLNRFFGETPYGRGLANKALAVPVFPIIVKAGFGFGGEYGEGELQIRGRPAGHHNFAAAR